MKNQKNIIVFVILLVVAVLIFVFKDKLFAGTINNSVSDNNGGNNATNQVNFFLTYGSNTQTVRLLQAYMNEYYNAGLAVDGIWGAKTQAAFEKMQAQVNFIASNKGITEAEFKNITPLYNYLSSKYPLKLPLGANG